MANRFKIETIFKAIDKMSAPVRKMQSRIGKMTRSMSRGLKKVTRQMKKFGSGVAAGARKAGIALLAIGAALVNVIATGARFQKTLIAAAVKFPESIRKGTEAFKELEAAARKIGSTTEFTAEQSAEALNFLAMAGFNAKGAIAALPGVVDLATVAQIELGEATDIASDALGAFNLMTKDHTQLGKNLARINNVIAKTTTSANTNTVEFFEAMKDGGPVATAAGASIETFAALVGQLANAGIKGSKAGTTLKNMFLKLSAPSSKAAKMLKDLGVNAVDSNGNLRDMLDILGELQKPLAKLGTAQQAAILDELFGKRAIAGVNVLLAVGAKRLREYRGEILNANDAATTMAAVMRDQLFGKWTAFLSAIEGVKVSVFSYVEGPLSDVIVKMTEWVRANEDLIAGKIGEFLKKVINNFANIVKWMKRIGIAVAVFFSLIAVLKTLTLILTLVNLVMAANPITLIVIGVLALIAAVAAAALLWDDFRNALVTTFNDVVTVIRDTVSNIINTWQGVVLFFSNVWLTIFGFFNEGVAKINSLVSLLTSAWTAVGTFFSGLWSNIGGFIFDVIDKIIGGVSIIVNALTGNFAGGSAIKFLQQSNEGQVNNGQNNIGGSQVITTREQITRSIEENRSVNSAEITIKDETGFARLTRGQFNKNISLESSGEF